MQIATQGRISRPESVPYALHRRVAMNAARPITPPIITAGT